MFEMPEAGIIPLDQSPRLIHSLCLLVEGGRRSSAISNKNAAYNVIRGSPDGTPCFWSSAHTCQCGWCCIYPVTCAYCGTFCFCIIGSANLYLRRCASHTNMLQSCRCSYQQVLAHDRLAAPQWRACAGRLLRQPKLKSRRQVKAQ